MGGSAKYRYGKKIAAAKASGASNDEIALLEKQMQEAINREKARKNTLDEATLVNSSLISEKSQKILNNLMQKKK